MSSQSARTATVGTGISATVTTGSSHRRPVARKGLQSLPLRSLVPVTLIPLLPAPLILAVCKRVKSLTSLSSLTSLPLRTSVLNKKSGFHVPTMIAFALSTITFMTRTTHAFTIPPLIPTRACGSAAETSGDCTRTYQVQRNGFNSIFKDFQPSSILFIKMSASNTPELSVQHINDDPDNESDEYVQVEMLEDSKVPVLAFIDTDQSDFPATGSPAVEQSLTASPGNVASTAAVGPTIVSETTGSSTTPSKLKVQYAALEPGTVVQIQVGDVSRARKAWKKRRRTDSPLLVPCSVLNVDLASTVRWNLIYLLEKFGQDKQQQQQQQQSTSETKTSTVSGGSGIRISLSELSRRSRTHLKASLREHATTLGYANVASLVKGLFRKPVQDAYGVKLVLSNPDDSNQDEQDDTDDVLESDGALLPHRNELWLETPLSRTRAQSRASEAAVLQFFTGDATSSSSSSTPLSNNHPADTLRHTGVVRNKRQLSSVPTTEIVKANQPNLYQLKPLSAALRVNQEDVDLGVIANGSLHAAVVFDYDPLGDAGVAPLLTLSLNPQRNQVRDRLKLKMQSFPKGMAPESVRYNFQDMHVGDGPITGKVIKLVKGGALVDCGVGRSTTGGGGISAPIYALLRFKDAIINPTDGGDANLSLRSPDLSQLDNMDNDDDDDEDWGDVFSTGDLDLLDDEEDVEEEGYEHVTKLSGNGVEESELDDESIDDENDNDSAVDEEVLAEFNLDNDDEFEEGEDITHLFDLYDDGRLAYRDPETGQVTVISNVDLSDEIMEEDDEEDDEDDINIEEDYEDDDDEDDDDDQPTLLGRFATRMSDVVPLSSQTTSSGTYKTRTLRPGDRIDVFVKLVSKQSSQLLVTMDSSVQGRKARDLKKESDVSKKVSRLAKQLGGFARIRELTGVQCNGVVKAVSNTGDWFYVQPEIDDSSVVPVGVATFSDQASQQRLVLEEGDAVRIVINGIDEDRGQLSMQILKKLVV